MVVDGAGWHKANALVMPDNIRFHLLPPYSPELNPQEHLWEELREKYFHNRAFDSLDALGERLVEGLAHLEQHPERVRSIIAWSRTITSITNAS